MKHILIVSNNDMCRSRMAQEILNSFGRGMKISTAGILAGNSVPDVVCQVMEQNGYDFSRRKPCDVETYAQQTWALYDIMHKELYEFFRSELMEKLLPRCSCGANTYCRCE